MICRSGLALLCLAVAWQCRASDHLDSPTVIADPRTDIGDVYAWMSPDHQKLNLVMTIVGHSFSDRVAYPMYLCTPGQSGLSPLEDQQCAGALMWTCVTVVFLVAGAVVSIQLLSPRTYPQATEGCRL